jgi:hypothetical protein
MPDWVADKQKRLAKWMDDERPELGNKRTTKNETPKMAPWRQTANFASDRTNPRRGDQATSDE